MKEMREWSVARNNIVVSEFTFSTQAFLDKMTKVSTFGTFVIFKK